MSILAELSELVSQAESVKLREQQMLDMFKLAGYELEHKPEFESQAEANDPDADYAVGEPKTLIELLKEALGNPPTEAGRWIRISDIPEYIKQNLTVLDVDELEEFNEQDRHRSSDKLVNDVPALDLPLPPGYNKTKLVYGSKQEVPIGSEAVDLVGNVWKHEDEDSWSLHGDPDKASYYDVDVEDGQLRGVQRSVRNRTRVL